MQKNRDNFRVFGPDETASNRLGALFEVTESVALRFRVPYYLVMNEFYDHGAGLECGLIFSSRFKHVMKLADR